MPRTWWTLICGAVLAACQASTPSRTDQASSASPEPPTPAAAEATAAPKPIDLGARPLTWFAPLPPMPGRTGSADFMAQFEPDAPWTGAAAHIQVYKLYGEWVAYHATDAQLRRAVEDIARRGMILAVEAGPLDAPADCGQGVESFAGAEEGRRIAQRIRGAGGRIDVLALDEPYFYATDYDGPNACHWYVPRTAAAVAAYVRSMRKVLPQLIVGDIEPTPAPVTSDGLADWLDAYRAAASEPFAFLHLDMDWTRPDWAASAQTMAADARDRDVPAGLIYNGGSAPRSEAWVQQAGDRVKAFEAAGSPPDHVVFQSWMTQPDHVLPDDDATSFSGLVRRYFDAHAELGTPTEGVGANLALRRAASASASLPGSDAAFAVDGNFDSTWNSGGGPPQWIEIDLGEPRTVGELRLTVAQSPEGPTEHRLTGRTAAGEIVLLDQFVGPTKDGTVLVASRAGGWRGIVAVRVETSASPSWVAWREIEVIGG